MSGFARFILALGFAAVFAAPAARAESDSQALVDKAHTVLAEMLSDQDSKPLQNNLRAARGVIIVPDLIKASFIFGLEGGNGVLLARTASGGWGYPSFVTVGNGSFGLQAGVKDQQVVMTLMSDGAVEAVIANEAGLGGEMGATVGPKGGGIGGATTTNFGGDIAMFSRSQGAFLGASFQGGVIHERDGLNAEYYQPGATARDIVLGGRYANPGADPLRAALGQF